MKNLRSLTFICLALLTIFLVRQAVQAQSAVDRPIKDKWALVIGIDRFEDKTIPPLRYSAKDARDFASFLVEKGNFARDHVLTLLNEEATDDNILKAIADSWLPKRALPDDLIVIYVSTHGSPKEIDIGKDNFLIAHNTRRDSLFSTGVRLKDLAKIARERTRCERIVLLLDACNSGAAEAGGKGLFRAGNFDIDGVAGEGQIVISSSSANQRSWESKRYKNGVFTKKLMDALFQDGASTTLNTAFSKLKDNVMQEVRFDRNADQTPLMKSKWEGRPLALLAKPSSPRKTLPYLKSKTTRKIAAVATRSIPGASATPEDEVDETIAVDEPTRLYKTALEFTKIKDFKQAFNNYLKAAKLGHVGAKGQLGCLYASGTGVEQNGDEAVKWLEEAADEGDAPARAQLGFLYLRGHFIKQDLEKARELIESAASAGNTQAKYFLGCMYLTGSGVTKNLDRAREYLKMAAEGGISKAGSVLKKLENTASSQ